MADYLQHRGLPWASGTLPGIGGRIKEQPADFVVEEIPAYEPCGAGEHLFLWIEKQDVSASELRRQIARRLAIRERDIGMAGLKDRRAITRQYVSVPATAEPRLAEMDSESIRVLESKAHRNKLKTGHLRGNRFEILIRDPLPEAAPRTAAIWDRLLQTGIPNYFGEQRFGIDRQTLITGHELAIGTRQPESLPRSQKRFLLRFALSALQSQLFNLVLRQRVTDDLLSQLIAGDVVRKSGGHRDSVVQDLQAAQVEIDQGTLLLTGPMFGPKMVPATAAAGVRESAVLEEAGLTMQDFARYPRLTSGTRRPLALAVSEFVATPTADGMQFNFELPAGSYATTVLREFQKLDEEQ